MHTNRFSETVRPLPVVAASFSSPKPEDELEIDLKSGKERVCYSSLTSSNSKQLSPEKKNYFRETFRYEEEEEINSLTNLFLPSLTSASYKKYNRKVSNSKNIAVEKNIFPACEFVVKPCSHLE